MSNQPMVEITIQVNNSQQLTMKIEHYRWVMLKSLVNSFRYKPDEAEWPVTKKEGK